MKLIIFVALSLLSTICVGQYKEIATLDGRFSIKIPDTFSDPELSAQSVESELGVLPMKMYTAVSQDDQVFVISYNDYPDSIFYASMIPTMMDNVRDGALSKMEATMERQMDYSLNGNPARTVNFKSIIEGTESYGRLDYIIVAPRLFQIIYITPDKKQRSSKDIKDAFASFKLITEEPEE